MHRLLAILRSYWFLLGLVLALILGFSFPDVGLALNPQSLTTGIIVIVLFFITGLTLPTDQIRAGLSEVKLHLYTQLFIFAFIPLYFVITRPLYAVAGPEVVIGILALAVLPTTVSSCIVFTQQSAGNVVGTIFNAATANILGVAISPLLLSLLLQGAGRTMPADELLQVLRNLSIRMLLPLLVGQLVRAAWRDQIAGQKKRLGVLGNIFILCIVFFSLARTALNPAFRDSLEKMLWPFTFLALSHLLLVAIAVGGARLLRFSPPSIVSVAYLAPQKTLALGAPLLATYFASTPELIGIAMLPLLFYHPWQLLIAGVIKSSAPVRALVAAQEGS